MIALVCVLAVVIGVLLLPVGVSASYDASGALVQLIVGGKRIQLFPRLRKAPKRKPVKGNKKESGSAATAKTKKGGSLSDFLPIFYVVWDLLQELRQKLTVDQLVVKLVLAGEDPCDLSVNYGRAWAALGNLMPRLENVLTIRKRDLDISCDYTADRPTVFFLMDITLSVGKLLSLAARYGWRGFIEYRKLLKIRKGGA